MPALFLTMSYIITENNGVNIINLSGSADVINHKSVAQVA